MRDLGIVRTVDDLGRVVIPKEIRTMLNMDSGTKVNIGITEEGDVIFSKHNPSKVRLTLEEFLKEVDEIAKSKDSLTIESLKAAITSRHNGD